MRIELLHVSQYGQDRYFPDNFLSENLLNLMGRKSFTLEQVKKLKEIDFTVVITQKSISPKV